MSMTPMLIIPVFFLTFSARADVPVLGSLTVNYKITKNIVKESEDGFVMTQEEVCKGTETSPIYDLRSDDSDGELPIAGLNCSSTVGGKDVDVIFLTLTGVNDPLDQGAVSAGSMLILDFSGWPEWKDASGRKSGTAARAKKSWKRKMMDDPATPADLAQLNDFEVATRDLKATSFLASLFEPQALECPNSKGMKERVTLKKGIVVPKSSGCTIINPEAFQIDVETQAAL